MLFLPRGIQAFLQGKAIEKETDVGSLMIDIIKKWAWDNGYNCSHPSYAKKLHIKGNFSTKKKPIFKCLLCGQTFEGDFKV